MSELDPLRHAFRFCPRCAAKMAVPGNDDSTPDDPRPTCPACGYVQYLNPSPAAGVVLLRDGKVCLVQRRFPPREGQWSLPAGFMEYDERPEQTAVREVLEETGLEVALTGLQGLYPAMLPPDFPVLLVVYRGEILGGEMKPGDDAAAVGFWPPDAPPGRVAFGSHRRVLAELTDELAGRRPVPVAVLLSGGGRTLRNFLRKIDQGLLPIRVVAVVSSRPGAGGLRIAADHGIPHRVFRRKDYPDAAAHSAAINQWLAPLGARMILLAGYLCYYVPPAGFTGPVLNIHPALLPAHGGQGLYGDRVHQAVLAAGETESGCTVHRVDEIYDHGEVLGQKRVPVLPDDDAHSLADRVFAAECELYPEVVGKLAREIQDADAKGRGSAG